MAPPCFASPARFATSTTTRSSSSRTATRSSSSSSRREKRPCSGSVPCPSLGERALSVPAAEGLRRPWRGRDGEPVPGLSRRARAGAVTAITLPRVLAPAAAGARGEPAVDRARDLAHLDVEREPRVELDHAVGRELLERLEGSVLPCSHQGVRV